MHALMSHKIVVHLHAVDILSYLVRKNLSKVDDKINGVNSIFIEYFKPGSELAEAIFHKLEGKNNINNESRYIYYHIDYYCFILLPFGYSW